MHIVHLSCIAPSSVYRYQKTGKPLFVNPNFFKKSGESCLSQPPCSRTFKFIIGDPSYPAITRPCYNLYFL